MAITDKNTSPSPASWVPTDRVVCQIAMKPLNPWNLTVKQSKVMDAICEFGCQKLAARHLKVAIKTVECHSADAGKKMGFQTYLARCLAWDRWRNGEKINVKVTV